MTDTQSNFISNTWTVEVISPEGRSTIMQFDRLLVDLAVIGPAAFLGRGVEDMVGRLLEAAPSKDDRPIETIPGIPPAIQPERQAKA
jgi:hypothetical protein